MDRIHLVCTGDVDDASIGETCAIDIRAVRALIEEAASQAEMTASVTEAIGDSFNHATLTSTVMELAPEGNDAVVFYYSGHGARGASKSDAWPVMSLASPAPPFDTFDLSWVYQTLHQKSPRLLLMFVDCCQQIVPDDILREQSPATFRGFRSAHAADNYGRLFREFRGEVLLMSCKPGQLSGCATERGGFFTATFLEAVYSLVNSAEEAVWEAVARLGSVPPQPDQQPIWKVVPSRTMRTTRAPGMEPFPGTWNLGEPVETDVVEEESAAATRSGAGRRFCGSCGAPLAADNLFCSNCGARAPVLVSGVGASAPRPSPGPPEGRTPRLQPETVGRAFLHHEERLARTRQEMEDRLAAFRARLKKP